MSLKTSFINLVQKGLNRREKIATTLEDTSTVYPAADSSEPKLEDTKIEVEIESLKG